MFNKDSIAYTPVQYHSILNAYGIQLSPEKVKSELGSVSSYAKVIDDKVVLGKASVAYSKSEWETILSAYEKPVVMEKKAPVPVVAEATPGDSDGDGVTDDLDKCPGTPRGIAVGERGCWALSNAFLHRRGDRQSPGDLERADRRAGGVRDWQLFGDWFGVFVRSLNLLTP